jgi:hypothetical protein
MIPLASSGQVFLAVVIASASWAIWALLRAENRDQASESSDEPEEPPAEGPVSGP